MPNGIVNIIILSMLVSAMEDRTIYLDNECKNSISNEEIWNLPFMVVNDIIKNKSLFYGYEKI
jgi:hypothetical protein